MTVLAFIEHDRGRLVPAALESLTFGRQLANSLSTQLEAITIGSEADKLAAQLGEFGATTVHQAHHELLGDFSPDGWADSIVTLIRTENFDAVVAAGSDRGNEVLAQVAARLDAPFVANVLPIEIDLITVDPDAPWQLTRVRWGGSLHERTELPADVKLLTVALHGVEPQRASTPSSARAQTFTPVLEPRASITVVRDRVEREAGVTLATASVVVGGGRGVGSAEGFAPLEDLAQLLGGVVGCSRAVTNNGWRNHTDQVGQTGTRIGAEVYFACGISGAIQHWVGASGAKCIIAINTDEGANIVTKADYAVIGDLHEVVPAIADEIRRRNAEHAR